MAWGSWSSSKWKNVASNSGYYLDVEWSYHQDVPANKTEYRVTQLRLRNKDGHHSIYAKATVGIATITAQRTTSSKDLSIATGGSQTINLTDDSRVREHNADGTLTGIELNVHGYCMVNAGVVDEPNFGWKVANIASEIPKIDRSGGTATATYVSKTYNSITFKLGSNVNTSKGRYRLNGGAWVGFTTPSELQVTGGGSANYTIKGLAPNTSYKIEVQINRDYTQVWSSTATFTQTTNKPAAPTVGAPSAGSITYNSAQITLASSTAGAGGSIASYQISSDNSAWSTVTFPYTVSALKPNTAYTRYVRCIDNYGTSSASKSVTFKTALPGRPVVSAVTLVSKTYNSATIKVTGAYGAGHPSDSNGHYQVKLSTDTMWTRVTNQNAHVISGLSPNTEYTIECQLVDAYGQVSVIKTLAVTTNKPAAPTKGTASVSDITSTSAKVSYSGFKAGAEATINHYEVAMREHPGDTSWVYNNLNTSYVGTGLPPNHDCVVFVRAVDNYGTPSDTVTVYFKTLEDQAKIYIKVDGLMKKGKVFRKDGSWKKGKNVFIKQGGEWKKNKN